MSIRKGFETKTIAVLCVQKNSLYEKAEGLDLYHIERNAFNYKGLLPVICHPDCARWGKLAKQHGRVAQDNGLFEFCLKTVHRVTGLVEHPAGSLAWKLFDLPVPSQAGGWTKPDKYGGRSCCVFQGHYGHRAPKETWLYGILDEYPDLKWGRTPKRDLSHLDESKRKRAIKTGIVQNLSRRQRKLTPGPFRDLLIGMVNPRGNEK